MARREELLGIFNDTEAKYRNNRMLQESIKSSIAKTVLYRESDYPEIKNKKEDTKVSVNKYRTIESAQYYKRKHPNWKVGVLNFASATNPGGGVRRGSSAQEECICRVSTLLPVLETEDNIKDYYQYHKDRNDIRYTDRIIYTPDITVFKVDGDRPVIIPEEKWIDIDVITCAAPNLRPIPNNFMNPGKDKAVTMSDTELYKLHKKRISHILAVASANNVEVLILGAFGSGAFNNNPEVVAQAYKDVLKDYIGHFKEVTFSVYCPLGKKENYEVYKKVFG